MNFFSKLLYIIGFFLAYGISVQSQTLTISTSTSSGSGWSWNSTTRTLSVTANATVNLTTFQGYFASGNVTVVGNTTTFGVTINNAITSSTSGSSLNIGASGNTGNITFTTGVSINGAVTVNGGAVAMNAATSITTSNTSTGDVTINATTISGTGNIVVASGRTALVNISSGSTYSGVISGGTSSAFTKAGNGQLTLTKNQTYTGTTTISGGNLLLNITANGGNLSSSSAVAIESAGSLLFQTKRLVNFPNAISGSGAIRFVNTDSIRISANLTSTAVQIESNSNVLDVMQRISYGTQFGTNAVDGGTTYTAGANYKVYDPVSNKGHVQFQQRNIVSGNTITVFAVVEQSGLNVTIKVNTSIYATGAGERPKQGNTYHIGSDNSSAGSGIALATSNTGAGAGIREIRMTGMVYLTGSVTLTGSIVVDRSGSLSVTGDNGSTIFDFGAAGISGSSLAANVDNKGLLTIDASSAATYSGTISSDGTTVQRGEPITLTGSNTFSGMTIINSGKTLNAGDGGTTGAIQGNIQNYGTLTFNRSNAFTYTGSISGTGSVAKNGSGTLTMSGANTYTGATTINAGTLVMERNIPSSASSGYSGAGSLVIQPSSASFTSAVTYPITGFTVSSSIGGLTVGKLGNTANLTVSSATSIAGPIAFYGGALSLNENVSSSTNGNISLYGNTLTIAAVKTVTSGGALKIAPSSVGNTIGIGGASGTLSIPASYFSTNFSDGFSGITIGSDNQTGNISANAFTLRDPVTFETTGTLSLGGLVNLGSYDVAIGSNVASASGIATGYFKTNGTGKVKRSILSSASFTLPVGNGSYNPLTIANNTGSVDEFSVKVDDAVLDAGTSGTAITEKVVKRTWFIDKTSANAGSGIDMTFQWDQSDEGTNLTDFKLSHYGILWAQAVGTSGSVSGTTTKKMTHIGYTGTFSPFAVGSSAKVVPVSWLDFTATLQKQMVALNWRTASEQNTKDFVVQHNTGNGNWKNIGSVAAAGNSSSERSYRFTHTQPIEGRNIYRLIQRDLDGKESMSKVVGVSLLLSSSVQVYPIPSKNGLVYLRMPSDQFLKLYNASGVLAWEGTGKAGVQLLDLQHLQKGLYYLQAGTETIRIMFQ